MIFFVENMFNMNLKTKLCFTQNNLTEIIAMGTQIYFGNSIKCMLYCHLTAVRRCQSKSVRNWVVEVSKTEIEKENTIFLKRTTGKKGPKSY